MRGPTHSVPHGERDPTILSEMEVCEYVRIPTSYHIAQSADKALKDVNFKLKMISESLLAQLAEVGCHKHLHPAMRFLPSQEWHYTETTTKFDRQGHQTY
jgi:hypothetical protein